MQRSTPLTRKARPARAPRNLEGTVSRCLASSVCSKVPWKAKAHAVRLVGRSSRSEVAEWEEPRHPGPAVRLGNYPTTSHSATHSSSFVPPDLTAVRTRTRFWSVSRDSMVGERCPRWSRPMQATVQIHPVNGRLRSERPVCSGQLPAPALAPRVGSGPLWTPPPSSSIRTSRPRSPTLRRSSEVATSTTGTGCWPARRRGASGPGRSSYARARSTGRCTYSPTGASSCRRPARRRCRSRLRPRSAKARSSMGGREPLRCARSPTASSSG
jgi:hypothetical protein